MFEHRYQCTDLAFVPPLSPLVVSTATAFTAGMVRATKAEVEPQRRHPHRAIDPIIDRTDKLGSAVSIALLFPIVAFGKGRSQAIETYV